MLAGASMALRWKSSGANNEGLKWVLSKTVFASARGNGQWASSAVQQAGRAGREFMLRILPGCAAAG